MDEYDLIRNEEFYNHHETPNIVYNRFYIYIGTNSRIIGIREYTHWYVPIKNFSYYIFEGGISQEIFKDLHNYCLKIKGDKLYISFKGNYSEYTFNKCTEEAKELEIWEKFETFISNYTKKFSNPIDIMNDIYLLDEIRNYIKTNDIGPLLTNIKDTDDNQYSIDDIVQSELIKIEDKKNILSFINTQKQNIKKMIANKQFEEVLNYIKG